MYTARSKVPYRRCPLAVPGPGQGYYYIEYTRSKYIQVKGKEGNHKLYTVVNGAIWYSRLWTVHGGWGTGYAATLHITGGGWQECIWM